MKTALIERDADWFLAPFGRELQQQWDATKGAVAKMEHLNDAWCRSRTSWSLENITLTLSGADPWKQMRQISAELESRRLAMSEAKYGLLNLQVDIEEARLRLEKSKDEIERKRMMITIAQKEEQIATVLRKFKGAMRDVRDLEIIYNARIGELGEVTEEAINAADRKANIARAFSQSIRSVRMTGRIDTGNQEYLEQCGVNPTYALTMIKAYLESESRSSDAGIDKLRLFVAEFVAAVIPELKHG